jgi:hypothetical protein
MNAILRRKKNWEHYHDQQVVVFVQNTQHLFQKGVRLVPFILSFCFYVAYRIFGIGVLVLKVLFIKPQLIQRIDPHSAVDVESISASKNNFMF